MELSSCTEFFFTEFLIERLGGRPERKKIPTGSRSPLLLRLLLDFLLRLFLLLVRFFLVVIFLSVPPSSVCVCAIFFAGLSHSWWARKRRRGIPREKARGSSSTSALKLVFFLCLHSLRLIRESPNPKAESKANRTPHHEIPEETHEKPDSNHFSPMKPNKISIKPYKTY